MDAGAFWQSVVDMQREGLLTSDELLRMNCPSAGRSVEQIEAPFDDGMFRGLSLSHVSPVENPDPFWQAFTDNGDRDQLGRSWALVMRAANGPNFAAGLHPQRDPAVFLDALTDRLAARIAGDPQRSRSHMILVAIEKVGPSK